MTLLVGFSGSHGTGKTVTIERIEQLEKPEPPHIIIDHFKVSRHVLSNMGLTLEQATANAEITKQYQQQVLDAKINRDSSYLVLKEQNLKNAVIVDRSVADIYAYTKLWSEKNKIDGEWFRTFTQKCIESIRIYDIILLFPIGKFAFVADGIRAKEDTQSTIAKYIEEFIVAYAKNYYVVDASSIDDRAKQIIQIIKNENH